MTASATRKPHSSFQSSPGRTANNSPGLQSCLFDGPHQNRAPEGAKEPFVTCTVRVRSIVASGAATVTGCAAALRTLQVTCMRLSAGHSQVRKSPRHSRPGVRHTEQRVLRGLHRSCSKGSASFEGPCRPMLRSRTNRPGIARVRIDCPSCSGRRAGRARQFLSLCASNP